MLVTNEGNGRLATTLPKTHVAVMGMERLPPGLGDLADLCNCCPGAAPGSASPRTSLPSPARARAGDADGPEESTW